MTGNMFALVRAAAPGNDRTFIKTHDGRVITYGDLFAVSGRYANVLRDRGVGFGDRVAVQVDKSAECVLLYLACLRLGAAYLPLNPAYTLAEVGYFVGDSEARIVVCAPERAGDIAPLAESLNVRETLTLGTDGKSGTLIALAQDVSPDFQDVDCATDDLAAILYTSGTTGRSKGAMLSHGNLASNALTLRDVWRFSGDDVLLNALPIFHTHGLFVASNVTLMAGGSMIFLPKLDADQIFKFLPESTVMMGVPTFYVRLLQDARLTRESTAHIRLFVSGSAPLLAETHAEWQARTGHAVLERYGMTETGMNTSNPYDGERIAGSVGPALPGVDIRIADPATGAPLPRGEIGMIELKGPNVFKGYWRMPEKTAAEFRPDGFFVTGDLGIIDANGYVAIVGRGKDLVISGGLNVYPKEIESEIDALAGIDETAVIGVPHPDFGEGVTAICTLKPGATLTEEAVLDQLRDRLAKYKQPKRVIFIDALPRNTMGKVQKAVLRETYKGLYQVVS